MKLVHVALVAPADVVTERLRSRSGAEEWGVERVERCVAALTKGCFAEHIDAAIATPMELAARIEGLVGRAV